MKWGVDHASDFHDANADASVQGSPAFATSVITGSSFSVSAASVPLIMSSPTDQNGVLLFSELSD